jgi:hypothetical protein
MPFGDVAGIDMAKEQVQFVIYDRVLVARLDSFCSLIL